MEMQQLKQLIEKTLKENPILFKINLIKNSDDLYFKLIMKKRFCSLFRVYY